MGEAFISRRGGGGAGGLNFRIVSGNVQPSTAKENDIWIETETNIESWVISVTEPENPVSGMVWIAEKVDSDVRFNMMKKNAIYVYPDAVKQYIDGSWENKAAYIYQNGWIPFSYANVYLFKDGDFCEDVTGGWDARGWRKDQYCTARKPVASEDGGVVTITFNHSDNYPSGIYETLADIDLTDYTALEINILEINNMSSSCILGVFESRSSTYPNSIAQLPLDGLGVGLHELDISDVTGEHPVGIFFHGKASRSIKFDMISLK